MALNVARFKSDIDRLMKDARNLELSLLVQVHGKDEVAKAIKKTSGPNAENKIDSELNNLISFNVAYESWYSETGALIRQVLPDRLNDFRGHYEIPKGRREITYATYRIHDALKGLRVTRPPYDSVVVDDKAAVPHFQQQMAILMAAQRRFESSLFELRQIVQADLFDSEIESARHLLRNKFLRAAGAIAGVVLEKHLLQVCMDHNIKITKKNPGINDLNQLLKDTGVIDVPQWRQVTFLGDIRNICDHSKDKEPTEQQVHDLIDGTDKVIKTIA